MLILTPEPFEGRRILLLDLVWTLAWRECKRENFADTIRQCEQYRRELVDQVLEDGWYVVLMTARHVRYREVTLEALARRIGFVPDVACFNELGGGPPAVKKRGLEKYIYPAFGQERSRYFALESNHLTRAMYAKEGIEAMRREDFFVDSSRFGKYNGIQQPELFGDLETKKITSPTQTAAAPQTQTRVGQPAGTPRPRPRPG